MVNGELGIEGLGDVRLLDDTGGFASVYAATDLELGRPVAVKVLRAVDARSNRLFDRERRTMARATGHGNIVTIFGSGYTEPDKHPYLLMEYMAGGSLQHRLERSGSMPTEEAVEIVVGVADGLAFAHSIGIVHKDIKPANILIGAAGTAKLSDFGIASLRNASVHSKVSLSLAYAPPEAFDAVEGPDGKIIDPRDERSDVYSLAATLYALVTGGPPFEGASDATLLHQILNVDPAPLDHAGLDPVLARALAKDPADRFESAEVFVAALRTIGPTTGVGGSAASPADPTVVAPADPTVVAPGPTVAAPEPEPAPLVEWGPYLHLPVAVDDVAGVTQLVAEAVGWCLAERGVFVVLDVGGDRFVQMLVEQNGDLVLETGRAGLALSAGLGWDGPVPGVEGLAGLSLPAGQVGRQTRVVELLVATFYRVHGFDHGQPIGVQTGVTASASSILGVVFERDVDLDVDVADFEELRQLVWHAVLWSLSTGWVVVVFDMTTGPIDAWLSMTVTGERQVELRSTTPPGTSDALRELGWEPVPEEAAIAHRLVEPADGDEDRSFDALMRAFAEVHRRSTPTSLRVIIRSL